MIDRATADLKDNPPLAIRSNLRRAPTDYRHRLWVDQGQSSGQGQTPSPLSSGNQRQSQGQSQGQTPSANQGQEQSQGQGPSQSSPSGNQGQGTQGQGQSQSPSGNQNQGQGQGQGQSQGQPPSGNQGQGQSSSGSQGQGQTFSGNQGKGQTPGPPPSGSPGPLPLGGSDNIGQGQSPSGGQGQGQSASGPITPGGSAGGRIIHVNTDLLRNCGLTFIQIGDQLKNQSQPQIQSNIGQLEGDWQGIHRQLYEQSFQNWRAAIDHMASLSADIGRHMQNLARGFEATDQG